MKTPSWVAVAAATLIGLSGCGVVSEIEDATSAISNAIDDDDSPVVDDGSLGTLLDASSGEDLFIEYRISESVATLWFVQVNTATGTVAISIVLDPGGLHNFTAAKTDSGWVDSPLGELEASVGFTPGLIATPGPNGVTYTWTNGATSWTIEADRQDRATYYRMDSPEGVFEMDFLYGADISQKLSREFIDAVVADLEASGSEYVFGSTSDDFQTWEFYDSF